MEDLKNENKALVKEIIKQQNAREHLANERTLLAWIRTSIGIMVFGFVVVKFSLFIKQLSILLQKDVVIPQHHGYSSVIGITLVTVGGIVLLLAFIKYKQTEKQLNNDSFKVSSTLVLSLTIIILLISVLLTLYLIENTSSY